MSAPGRTALLVVDVLDTFDHPDGDLALERMRERAGALREAIAAARGRGWAVVYVNDDHGEPDDPPAVVRKALEGPGGPVIATVAPESGDPLLLKSEYSAFDGTRLLGLLRGAGVTRVVVVGAVTEMCVRDSAVDARANGFATEVLRAAAVPLDGADEREALSELERRGVTVREWPEPGGGPDPPSAGAAEP